MAIPSKFILEPWLKSKFEKAFKITVDVERMENGDTVWIKVIDKEPKPMLKRGAITLILLNSLDWFLQVIGEHMGPKVEEIWVPEDIIKEGELMKSLPINPARGSQLTQAQREIIESAYTVSTDVKRELDADHILVTIKQNVECRILPREAITGSLIQALNLSLMQIEKIVGVKCEGINVPSTILEKARKAGVPLEWK